MTDPTCPMTDIGCPRGAPATVHPTPHSTLLTGGDCVIAALDSNRAPLADLYRGRHLGMVCVKRSEEHLGHGRLPARRAALPLGRPEQMVENGGHTDRVVAATDNQTIVATDASCAGLPWGCVPERSRLISGYCSPSPARVGGAFFLSRGCLCVQLW